MKLENETDHMAILALMMAGILAGRLNELGQLDEKTAQHLHHLVRSVNAHAKFSGLEELNVLFANLDRTIGEPHGALSPG